MPTHQLESSCLAGDPCAAGTSGTPSGPLSSPLWAAPRDPLQAPHPTLPQAALGAVGVYAEGPGDKKSGMIFKVNNLYEAHSQEQHQQYIYIYIYMSTQFVYIYNYF